MQNAIFLDTKRTLIFIYKYFSHVPRPPVDCQLAKREGLVINVCV